MLVWDKYHLIIAEGKVQGDSFHSMKLYWQLYYFRILSKYYLICPQDFKIGVYMLLGISFFVVVVLFEAGFLKAGLELTEFSLPLPLPPESWY